MALEHAPPLPQEFPSLALARRPGVMPTRTAGQGHVIRDLRPFVEGDDPRHIDAAASARMGSLHLRSFHEDREGHLILIADFRRPMLWGSQTRLRSVAAAEVLMRMGWRAMGEGGAVGLITLSDQGVEITSARPRRAGLLRVASHMARVHQSALARMQDTTTPALDAILSSVLRQVPRGAMIAVASGLDDPGPALSAAFRATARRGALSLLLIEDAFERAPSVSALPTYRADRQAQAFLSFAGLEQVRKKRAEDLHLPGVRVIRVPAEQGLWGGGQ